MATHQFDVDTAVLHGIEAAILLENIRFWLTKNKANGVNIKEGFVWTYNSGEAFHELFPYIERRQICRVLTALCSKGILIQKKLNEAKFDKTWWYTIPAEFAVTNGVFKPEPLINPIGQFDQSNGQNDQRIGQNDQRIGQNDQRIGQNVHPIPDINSSYKQTDNKQQINKAVDNSKPKKPDELFLLSEFGIVGDLAEDFIAHRKSKKANISKTVLNAIMAEAVKANVSLKTALETMILRNWQGFKAEWMLDKQSNQQSSQPDRKDFSTPAQYIPNPLGAGNEKQVN